MQYHSIPFTVISYLYKYITGILDTQIYIEILFLSAQLLLGHSCCVIFVNMLGFAKIVQTVKKCSK